MVMIYRHLISNGYTEAANNMSRECNIDLDKWEIADNIDLYYIVQDFEEYFEMKFMKKPIMVKKAPETAADIRQKRGLPPKNGVGTKGSTPSTSASEKGAPVLSGSKRASGSI